MTDTCQTCGAPVRMMVTKDTGHCSQLCQNNKPKRRKIQDGDQIITDATAGHAP